MMNRAYAVPSFIHVSFHRCVDHLPDIAVDHLPIIYQTSAFLLVRLKIYYNIILFDHEGIKHTKEFDESVGDDRGVMAVDRLQVFCDVAVRSAADVIQTQLAPATIEIKPLNLTVNNICHFFSEIVLSGPDVPTTPKITTDCPVHVIFKSS